MGIVATLKALLLRHAAQLHDAKMAATAMATSAATARPAADPPTVAAWVAAHGFVARRVTLLDALRPLVHPHAHVIVRRPRPVPPLARVTSASRLSPISPAPKIKGAGEDDARLAGPGTAEWPPGRATPSPVVLAAVACACTRWCAAT